MSESEPRRGARLSRRAVILGAATAVTGLAVFNRDAIDRLIDGRVGAQYRDLRWFVTDLHHTDESADWQRYSGDPDAIKLLERTWSKAGGLATDKAAFDSRTMEIRASVSELSKLGMKPSVVQAISAQFGGKKYVGIAQEGEDPNFFGLTADKRDYLTASRISPQGLSVVLGHNVIYNPDKLESSYFWAVPTLGLPSVQFGDLAHTHPDATWVQPPA